MEDHLVMSEGSIHQEDITTPNFYVCNNIVLKYVQVKLREGQEEKDKSIIIAWNLNTTLSENYRTNKTKEISEDMENLKDLNNKLNQINKQNNQRIHIIFKHITNVQKWAICYETKQV